MGNNMACIGISAKDQEDFGRVMESLLERSREAGRLDGYELRVWSDASGARISFVLGDGGVACATPGFSTETRVQARAKTFAEDPGCRFCDPLVVDIVTASGEICYPLVTQIDDILLSRNRVAPGSPLELGINAFAHRIQVWPDKASYEAGQEGTEPHFASESFIPSGLFTPDGQPQAPEPKAILTGHVLSAELRKNGATGALFQHAVVQTFGGRYDVLMSPAELEAPMLPGNILQGSFWLVGQVTQGLTDAPKPGLLRRLFRS